MCKRACVRACVSACVSCRWATGHLVVRTHRRIRCIFPTYGDGRSAAPSLRWVLNKHPALKQFVPVRSDLILLGLHARTSNVKYIYPEGGVLARHSCYALRGRRTARTEYVEINHSHTLAGIQAVNRMHTMCALFVLSVYLRYV